MAHIKSYPVVEKQEAIWIWMGDPALADESKIIDWPFHKGGATPLRTRRAAAVQGELPDAGR